jgi:Leucine-rich repeat (LRR) protein
LLWARKLEAAGIAFDLAQEPSGFYFVSVHDPKFTDCSIFKGSSVRGLDLDRSSVVDLGPLRDLALETLSLKETKATDLTPLRSPTLRDSLRELRLGQTKFADFSPVAGCVNLQKFGANETRLSDLSVVKGLKNLRTLQIARTAVADIAPLAGKPLETVNIAGTPVTEISPLLRCPTLRSLVLPRAAWDVESLGALPNLKRISYAASSNGDPDMSATAFWNELEKEERWITVLRKAKLNVRIRRQDDGSWELLLQDAPITDISMLKNANITRLSLMRTPVSDLSPLRGMKLTYLMLTDTKVTDLSPLKGMPIENLNLARTPVRDVTPLKGMPLHNLSMTDCAGITDVSPLKETKTLEILILPPGAKDFEFLRQFRNLKLLGYRYDDHNHGPNQTATKFWAEFDRAKSAAAP